MSEGSPVDSNSDSSDDGQEIKVKIKIPQKKQSSNGNVGEFCIGFVFVIILALGLIYAEQGQSSKCQEQQRAIFNETQSLTKDNQTDHALTKSTSDSAQEPILAHNLQPNPPKSVPALHLASSSKTKMFKNSKFQYQSVRDGTIFWHTTREISCQSDTIINSASKLSQNLFMQKTPYTHVNIIYHQVTIPAENVYQYEAVHQLIRNITKRSQNVIAYAHSSPLLLVLTATHSKNGFIVSNSSDWLLLRQNLVVNDLLPLANPYPLQQIVDSQGYNVLITEDFSFVKVLLFEQKRQLVLIVQLNSPISIETYVLLKLKVYKFKEGRQCDERSIEIYDESRWHLEDQTSFMPGWYVFTTEAYSLPVAWEKKNYETAVYSQRKLKCIIKASFSPASQAINSKYLVTQVPYEGIHLLRLINDTVSGHQHYQSVIIYFQQHSISSLCILSGPYYLMLLLISTLSTSVPVTIDAKYDDYSLLVKNMVLNNLQAPIKKQSIQSVQRNAIVVSTSFEKAATLSPASILLVSSQMQKATISDYSIFSFTQQQECAQSILTPLPSSNLSPGIYLLQMQQRGGS